MKGLSLGGLLLTLILGACSSDDDPAPSEATGGTLLFDVVDVTWTFDDRPTPMADLPIEAQDLDILVPSNVPNVGGGSVNLLVERAVPTENYHGTIRVEWLNDANERLFASLKTQSDREPPTCEGRLEGGGWDPVIVRGVEGCTLRSETSLVILEWTSEQSFHHFETGSVSQEEALRWLEEWALLPPT